MRISDWSSDVCSSDLSRHGASTAATCGNDEEVLRTAIDCDRIADALARDPRVAVISGCLDVTCWTPSSLMQILLHSSTAPAGFRHITAVIVAKDEDSLAMMPLCRTIDRKSVE